MKRFKRSLLSWCYGLIGGCFGGGISSISAKLGLDGLHSMGVDVPTLSLKQMGYVFLSGVLTHGILFVMKSPLPPLEFDDTNPPFPKADGSNVKPQETTENKTPTSP